MTIDAHFLYIYNYASNIGLIKICEVLCSLIVFLLIEESLQLSFIFEKINFKFYVLLEVVLPSNPDSIILQLNPVIWYQIDITDFLEKN